MSAAFAEKVVDPHKIRERTLEDTAPLPFDLLANEAIIPQFREAFVAVVKAADAAEGDESHYGPLIDAVRVMRKLLIDFNEKGNEIDTDLAYWLIQRSEVDITRITGRVGNAVLNAFREAAEAAEIHVAAEPVVPEIEEGPKKRNKILFGRYKGKLTHEMIAEWGWAEFKATGKRPLVKGSDLIEYGPLVGSGLTPSAVWMAVENGSHGLPVGKSLLDIFDDAGIPKGNEITHLDIIRTAWAVYHWTGHRLTGNDTFEIKHGPLADAEETGKNLNNSLRVGLRSLPGGETLSQILDAAGVPRYKAEREACPPARLSGGNYKGKLTHEMIIESAWAEREATGRRPVATDTYIIVHGPLVKAGLTSEDVHAALRYGHHELPGGEYLTEVLNRAGVPGGDYEGKVGLLDVIVACWDFYDATGRRITNDYKDPIEYGVFVGTSVTGKNLDDALSRGFYGLPGGLTLSEIQNLACVPKTKVQRAACPPANLQVEAEPEENAEILAGISELSPAA